MTTTLSGMTKERWSALSMTERSAAWKRMGERERDEYRDLSGLTKQLIGLEGWRVEVEDMYGDTRRFYVGRSTGWMPCHTEVKTNRSLGGLSADKEYKSVRRLYKRW
jgi:hypothetical protein